MDHTLKAFDNDLSALKTRVAEMGGLAAGAVVDALRALVEGDAGAAQAVIDRDRDLDIMELEIEEAAVRLMAIRQPVAVDLRQAVSALKMAFNLERCGDLAKNIAKRALLLAPADRPAELMAPIQKLGDLVRRRLDAVLQAYADEDLIKADDVWSLDQEVDERYEALFREVLGYMMGDSNVIAAGSQLLFVAKNLERIGDHATNIAEIVHYRITGEQLTERPKIDTLRI